MLKQEALAPAGVRTRKARLRDPAVARLSGTLVVVAAVAIALGAMLVAPRLTTSPVTAMVDRNIAAWNDFDEQTIRGVYTDDAFIFASSESAPVASGIDEIVALARWGRFSIQRQGPLTERGSLLSFPAHISTAYDVAGDVALVVMLVRENRIAQHWVIWGD